MAKKSKKTTKRPAKPRKKATTKAKKPAVKAAKKPTRTAAAKPARKPAVKAKTSAKPAKSSLTPSKPSAPAKPAIAAKTAERVPVAAAPATNGTSYSANLPADDSIIDHVYPGPLSEEQLRKVKTDLSKKDLAHFREVLLEKRAEILGDVEGLEQHRTAGAGEMSHMPLHPADVGSDHYEQEFNLGLMQSEKRLLREIDDALLRIQKGTYGVCHDSGKPIPRARLEIKPWAKYTIEAAMEREKRGLH